MCWPFDGPCKFFVHAYSMHVAGLVLTDEVFVDVLQQLKSLHLGPSTQFGDIQVLHVSANSRTVSANCT